MLGACSDAVADGCAGDPARGISLTELALYQAGKITLITDAGTLAPAERNADVVVGKDGLLRAFVSPEADWEDRVLSARLVLANGSQVDQFFYKMVVTGASQEASLATTFNFDLPGALMREETRYSLELVECELPVGKSYTARLPPGGTAELLARDVGPLRIEFIPIVANGFMPHTSEDHLDALVRYMRAMYPISDLEYSVGPQMTAEVPIGIDDGWEQVLQQLSQRHQSDDASTQLYYYGLLEPAATLDDYCPDGCTVGIGYVADAVPQDRHYRVAMGVSYGDLYSAETMAHEVGHNHGREHAPCGGPSDPDPDYPYAGARLGWWGFEPSDLLWPPSSTPDIMSYCENPWISDYTYQGLLERTASINTAALDVVRAPVGRWRIVVLTPRGPVWGVSPTGPVEAAGQPEAAVILDRQGNPVVEVTVYRMPMGKPGAASVMVPAPEPGWHAIVLAGELPLTFAAKDQSIR